MRNSKPHHPRKHNIQQHSMSLSKLAHILKRNQIRMKQLYKVPFERNSQRNKELSRAYVDGQLEMDAHAIPHEFIFIDEAWFNLAKSRRRGRNIIGHRAIIDVPGQRGGNITMCAAISNKHGVLHCHANLGPYNTAHILTFLDRLHNIFIPPECMNDADHQRNSYVVVWDNVSFHRAAPVQTWFADLPRYSQFLNPIEEFFSEWQWKVYDWQPFVRMPLTQAMEEACDEIDVDVIQGWIRHSSFFPQCLAREDIACDVDEALWPNPAVQGRHSGSSASILPYPLPPLLSHQPSPCPPSLHICCTDYFGEKKKKQQHVCVSANISV
ncbi:hypothetical protein SRHO_G00270640, partial [Serrasalmus rhombeus]